MQFLDPKKMVMNGLLINQSVKGTDMILTSDSTGLVSWKPTSTYTNNKDYDHYIGELFGGGVVVAVWRESNVEKCLVAAVKDVASVLSFTTGGPSITTSYSNNYLYPWSNVNTVRSSATHSTYGATNSALIVGQVGIDNTMDPTININGDSVSGFSAAAKWTDVYVNTDIGYGVFNDWYLPSILELSALASNMMIINKVLYQLCIDKGISLIDVSNSGIKSGNIPSLVTLLTGEYWSSTEKDATSAYYLSTTTSKILSGPKFEWFIDPLQNMKRVRPFRIASDNQVSFKFDSDWIIITYKFLDGSDLDTRTRMIYPNSTSHPSLITPWNENVAYNNGVNGGPKSSNFIGYSSTAQWSPLTVWTNGPGAYTPNVTDTIPAPVGFYNPPLYGNNVAGTYSIIRWGGDVQGTGGSSKYENILVNVTAFKFHFPGVDTIRIDCRGNWYGTRGSTVVRLGVDMYKGGTPVPPVSDPNEGRVWGMSNPVSSLSLDSLDVPAQSIFKGTSTGTLTPEGQLDSTRIAIVEYNINTKIGKIIT